MTETRQKKRTFGTYWILGLVLFCLWPIQVNAEKEKKTDALEKFTVQAVLPESQINQEINYFHLLVKPQEKQTVKVKVFNQSDQKQRYEVVVNPATTNTNGLLVYDETHKQRDDSLTVPISEVAKPTEKEVEVAAQSEKEIEVQIAPPKEPFEGLLLGGISVRPISKESKSKESLAIQNRLSYTIALMLTEKADTPIYGESKMNLLRVEPKVTGGKRVIEAKIQNPAAFIVKEAVVKGTVTKKGQQDSLATQTIKKVKFAPNSQFVFQIDVGQKKLEAGAYRFQGTIETPKGTQTLKEDFQVTEKKAETINQALKKESHTTMVVLLIAFFVVALLLCIILYRKKRGGRE